MVLKKQGRYEEAESFYQQALRIRERWHDTNHPEVANSLNNLAELYKAQQKYEQARPLLLRAYQIHKMNRAPGRFLINRFFDLIELYFIIDHDLPTFEKVREIFDRLRNNVFEDALMADRYGHGSIEVLEHLEEAWAEVIPDLH